MSIELSITLKPTGEKFDVPCAIDTVIGYLIKYVCSNSEILSNSNYEHYYLAVNNDDTLDNNRTVGEARLNQLDQNVRLYVCLRTLILMNRISESRIKFWNAVDRQCSQHEQKMKSNETAINNSKRPKKSLANLLRYIIK